MNYSMITTTGLFGFAHNAIRGRIKGGIYSKRSSIYLARNASARFTVPSSGTITDAHGNKRAGTEDLTYLLYLREDVGDKQRNYPGVDVISSTLDGYVVYPSKLDPRIIPGTTGYLTFGNDQEAKCVVLDARFEFGSTGAIGSLLQQVLGDSIMIEKKWEG
jgi:hypothetical protein